MPIMAKLDGEWGFALPVRFVCPANNLVVHNGCGLCSKYSLICAGGQNRGTKTTIYTEKWHPIHIGGQDLGRYINKKISDNRLIIRDFFRDPAGARTRDPNIKSVVLYRLSYRINAFQVEYSSFWWCKCSDNFWDKQIFG